MRNDNQEIKEENVKKGSINNGTDPPIKGKLDFLNSSHVHLAAPGTDLPSRDPACCQLSFTSTLNSPFYCLLS